MDTGTTTTSEPTRWYALDPGEVAARLETHAEQGLSAAEAAIRLSRHGPNEITAEPPPSAVTVALGQLRDPMNLMLVAVAIISIVIGEVSTGILVGLLVALNVVMGTQQELKARASVDALAKMQIPQAKVTRGGSLQQIPATELVPGDVVSVEAGDLVPADGRIIRAATLETQEAALTGESAPVAKDAAVLPDNDIGIGDRHNMAFQNTSVTRGTASLIITTTGMETEMGRIAEMLTSVKRTRSPLQRELDSLTKVIGIIAWAAVAVIIVMGLARGLDGADLLLLGTAMAISAIPTGLPTFVQAMLSYGARQLAEAKAVVKNLTDVETLGSTSAINTDKTGTLTLNEMMARHLYFQGEWFKVEGEGYEKSGAILGVAGLPPPDLTRLSYGLVLCSDATVSDDGAVVGDPTEAALVVLAAKVGVDAAETRRAYPREAEVPFDSDYKFMATFHRVLLEGEERTVELIKGAPDVVLARCSETVGPDGAVMRMDEAARAEVEAANQRLSEEGLRVLSFAGRVIEDEEIPAMRADPMSFVDELRFIALVGIIDPLRSEAKDAVATAHRAGIDVRMITGDYALTAQAIGKELGLGSGAVSGSEFREMTDEAIVQRLPDLHVFGRVAPEDKLRLVRLMQEQDMIVAMTGDAVNDAAALKQADIGVAMGTGSEVTKQAAKMILTDDNFGTLVHAVELGRSIYAKVVSYIRYQMSQLLSLVLLFLAASILNINDGIALTPSMVLFLNFFIAAFPVVVIMLDEVSAGVMDRPPRDPTLTITNRNAVSRWILYGSTLFLMTLVPLVAGPDDLSTDAASVSMTMAFVVISLGTIFSGLVMRRDPESGLTAPILRAVAILAIPVALTVLATESHFMQRLLTTQELTDRQWLGAIGLALVVPAVVESEKAIRRWRHPAPPRHRVEPSVNPARAVPERATVDT
jgi:Ca2+-transporting ATPase